MLGSTKASYSLNRCWCPRFITILCSFHFHGRCFWSQSFWFWFGWEFGNADCWAEHADLVSITLNDSKATSLCLACCERLDSHHRSWCYQLLQPFQFWVLDRLQIAFVHLPRLWCSNLAMLVWKPLETLDRATEVDTSLGGSWSSWSFAFVFHSQPFV